MNAPARATLSGVPWQLLNLPAFPSVSAKALQLLSGNDTRLLDLYNVISSDPSFSSEVLRVANSPLYALQSTIKNLTQAAMLLGFERLKGVAVTIGIRSYLKDVLAVPALRACWRHSLASALIAEEASTASPMRSDDAYTAGMLHDIGRIAMAAIRPKPYADLLRSAETQPCDILQCERDLFGVDHCEAGRALVAAWNLPEELASISSHHHDDVRGREFDLNSVVHYSCRFADTLGFPAVRPLHPRGYEELLAEVPLPQRRMFTFEPQTMAQSITSKIDALDSL
jgi:HD-like signal output (HDOD) protein